MSSRTSDLSAPFYKQFDGESVRDKAMYETIGRIVVAWGAAESALAKFWWHRSFESGRELSRDKVYRAPLAEKLSATRKLTPADGSRADQQLAILEGAFPNLESDRHALVHGYLGFTAKGPASINLRNDHATCAVDLDELFEWSVYLADVAHQLHREATSAIYSGEERIFVPDPTAPAPYVRTVIPGLAKSSA